MFRLKEQWLDVRAKLVSKEKRGTQEECDQNLMHNNAIQFPSDVHTPDARHAHDARMENFIS